MKKQLIDEDVAIGTHFLPAIINDDLSGLEEVDHQQLSEWWYNLHQEHGYGAYVFDYDTDSSFSRCQISGLMSFCYFIKITKLS